MLVRLRTAAVAASLLAPLAVAVPAGATHDGSGPHARDTADSCPPGRVQPAHFSDVAADSVHRAGVDCVVWWDAASGRNVAEYAPTVEVTRGQMATFLRNLVVQSGGTLPTPTKDHFSDDNGTFHEQSINLVAEAGIVSGRADGTYGEDAPVQRDQMATFLVQAYEYRADRALPSADTDAFSDDDGTTHEDSIDRAAAAGFAAGVGDDRYAPRDLVRRDQMASFLSRVLDLLVEDGLAEPPAGRPGDFDLGFGDEGSTRLAFGTAYAEATDVVVAPDGGLVLAGFSSGDDDQDPTQHVAVARLLADGEPDPAFGDDGRVTTVTGASSRATAVVVQPDGKIVVGGVVQPVAGEIDSEDYLLVRYNTDGSLDPTFGEAGVVTQSFRGPGYLSDLVLQEDGGILAGGNALVDRDSFNTSDIVIARFLPDGTLDADFGGSGTAQTNVQGGPDDAAAMVVQPDGAIVVAGTSAPPDGSNEDSEITLVRYLADGTQDPSFGDGGITRSETGFFETLTGVSLQSDGSIVAAGRNLNDERTVRRMLVARYSPAGELDPTFGEGGVVITEAAPQSEAADITVDADDRVLVVGHGVDNSNEDGKSWLVVRYLPDGAQDETFGDAGVVRTPIGKYANAVALQEDGIVVAGCDCPFVTSFRGGFESHSSFVVARLRPSVATTTPSPSASSPASSRPPVPADCRNAPTV